MGATDIEDIYRLTLTHQGMLFECLVAGDPHLYVAQASMVAAGDVNADALTHPAGLVASRHAALLTSFLWEGVPEPVQVVHREADLPVTLAPSALRLRTCASTRRRVSAKSSEGGN
jgi:hypothetical protein